MTQSIYDQFESTSYLDGGNFAYLEDLYEAYLKNPNDVDDNWRRYFASLGSGGDISHRDIEKHFAESAKQPRGIVSSMPSSEKQESVDALITAYRRFGHLNAKIDPLGNLAPVDVRLTLEHYGLSEANFDRQYKTRFLFDREVVSLGEIYSKLQEVYCGSVGIEYTRIANEEERAWLRHNVEAKMYKKELSNDVKRNVLKQLTHAEGLEKYLGTRFPGQKRFSIEGVDSLIPLMDELSKRARAAHVTELIIGMAHRGRLNVLLNIMGQSPRELFQEFEGKKEIGMTSGDVKYHRGYSSDVNTDNGPIHLSLMFNPSHLEFVDPVVMGSTRARQERNGFHNKFAYAVPVVIHGDAAFAGQGVVMETLAMSQTRAYNVGGSIHIITNNQVGFTISNPHDSRSSHYCSDLARMIDIPVFHVNADDAEAVVKVTQLALDYRMKFNKDVVIDLVGYRRHGHNEADEPRVTQPIMYQQIDAHPTTRTIYAEKLVKENLVTQEEVDQLIDAYSAQLDEGKQVVEAVREGLSDHNAANWTPFIGQHWRIDVDTTVSMERLKTLGKKITQYPENFALQRNVAMIVDSRKKMTAGEMPLDWGYAEMMAYASLLEEGFPVRMSGEDVRRGTFFHRHAVSFDQNTGEEYMPLAHLSEGQAHMQIYDSLLAETGPMGFEYGYSTADPRALVLWEAQFGDFANVGQVIVDQFLSSAWQKWNRLSGLVLLLPHGNEGMGPEHSSARLERYLELCGQENMQVIVPTTPAQIFHFLRRQVLRPYRKPLIVMSPKSFLRHKLAVSTLEELANTQVQLIIPEVDTINNDKVDRVILCSGKIYYELLVQRREKNIDNIPLIRIEQLYPFPYDELEAELKQYPNAKEIVWCQEEPKNQGAWYSTRHRIEKCLPEGMVLTYVGRHSMSAPASGYLPMHKITQQEVIDNALKLVAEK